MSDRAVSLDRAEAFTKILPSTPNLSSHQAGWENFFLAYYHEHPGCESPQSSFQQHALDIIDPSCESWHERCLGDRHLSYRLQGGETCFCPADITHWTRWEQPISFTVITFELDLFTRISQQMYDRDRLELIPQWQIFDPTIQAIVRLVENALRSEMCVNMQRLEKANPVPEYLLAALTGQLPEPNSIDIPTLGIWSERDEFLWESQMKNSGKYISAEWQYTRIEQTGHWFMLEQPDKTNQLLLSWLAKHS